MIIFTPTFKIALHYTKMIKAYHNSKFVKIKSSIQTCKETGILGYNITLITFVFNLRIKFNNNRTSNAKVNLIRLFDVTTSKGIPNNWMTTCDITK